MARGLFNKAIIESGGGRGSLMGDRKLSESLGGAISLEEVGVNFARKSGIQGVDATALAKLRALSPEAVTDGLDMMAMMSANGAPTYGGPIIDGKVVTENPDAAYKAGKQAKTPLIIGANSADIGLGAARDIDGLFAPFGPRRAEAMAAYHANADSDVSKIAAVVAMDRMMVEPARFVASEFARQGLSAYEYRFSYVADSMRSEWATGAPHATEIPYVFDTVAAKYGAKLTATDEKAARTVNAYWTNFAKTGDPNGPGLPRWPRYSAAKDQLMNVQPDGTAQAQSDPWKTRLDLTAAAAESR
jgi:para-nitrobenzyl esterase